MEPLWQLIDRVNTLMMLEVELMKMIKTFSCEFNQLMMPLFLASFNHHLFCLK